MKRCVIDTNVLVTANKALSCDPNDEVLKYPKLLENCIKVLKEIKDKCTYVVLDENDEIIKEYKRYLNFSGQPGFGDVFFKWLHDNRYSFPASERVCLHKTKCGYQEFPIKMRAINIDPSDMKFFAVSNAHPSKPIIVEATDTKWWNWAEKAKQCGIRIKFLDEQYMRNHNI
jgi:hypothetical protein